MPASGGGTGRQHHAQASRVCNTEDFVTNLTAFNRRHPPTRRGRFSGQLHVELLEVRTVPSTWVEQGPGPIIPGTFEAPPGLDAGAVEALVASPTDPSL